MIMAKKILVVDDDRTGVALMAARLHAEGFEVVTAYDGVAALERVKADHPDLVVLDVEMPEMNGYTFVLELKKLPGVSHTPVIVMTSLEENQPIFARKGVLDYMVKPVDFDKLFAMIEHQIGK
jgi:two-component system cell cycle response regulator